MTEEIPIHNTAELRDWLTSNHAQPDGIWLVTYKKSDPDRYVSTGEIIDECLCFGWVDSKSKGKDSDRTMLYISPRKTGSTWSRVNKDKITRLTAADLIMPPGQALIDAAIADGSWTLLDDVENLIVPKDLQSAFHAQFGSEVNWHGFPRSTKRNALAHLHAAKRPATRADRIARIVSDSAAGIRPFA